MQAEEVKTASPELAHILGIHGRTYMQENPTTCDQRKVIGDIIRCRTPVMGGHLETCQNRCGYQRLSFNSCRNRHCPKCQNLPQIRWVAQRSRKLLPSPYFHVVLTLPHQLNPLLLRNKKLLYSNLFKSASRAMLQLAQTWPRLQAQPGFTAILHTWNQDLLYHVHLHIVVTAGGIDKEGSRWIPAKNNFLVPIRALAKIFRGKFLDALADDFREGKVELTSNTRDLEHPQPRKKFIGDLRRTKWYAYAKPPFQGPLHVYNYLGRYTHRTAISNQRILAFDGDTVVFRARDNSKPGTYRRVQLHAREFIRRFLLHVVPTGFVRIRHFGLLASRNAKTKWCTARSLLLQHPVSEGSQVSPVPQPQLSNELLADWKRLLLKFTGFDVTRCPRCKGKMLRLPLPVPGPLRVAALDSS